MTSRALVLGGGGVAGIGWETGLLFGLQEAGVDVLAADLIVGTSAGSTVAAQITSGVALEELFDRKVDPARPPTEIRVDFDVDKMIAEIAPLLAGPAPGRERRKAFGQWALQTPTVSEPARRAVIEARLPSTAWPDRPLRIVAVDAETGDPRIFTEAGPVSMVDAVTASCAVPGLWPPATIDGRRYVDGGIRTMANADLAAGHDVVLVLAPMADLGEFDPEVAATTAQMERTSRVLTIRPDDASLAAIGSNPLDPDTARPAAIAGRAQAAAVADDVRILWTS